MSDNKKTLCMKIRQRDKKLTIIVCSYTTMKKLKTYGL